MVLSSWLPDSVEIRGWPLVGGLKTGTGWESENEPLTTYYTNTMLLVMNETDAYRLEALLELAASFPEPRTAAQIARRRKVPERFLARLLGELAREGLVTTSRGPRGGVKLPARPETVPLASLVRPEAQPETGGTAVRWLAKHLAETRAGALERLTLADLTQLERSTNTAVDFDI